jgi:uncharacterized protein
MSILSPALVVVGYSARLLAACAAQAGFAPLSIDVFGDDDTREMSLASVKLEGGLSEGLAPDKVAGAAEMLVSAHNPIGLVYGAGFEHQPETIAAIAQRIRVLGNSADILKRAKDPLALAQMCERNSVRHPQVVFATPDEPEHWLTKRRGGAGGSHIATADASSSADPDSYFQRRVGGKSISALFLASKRKAVIIGLSMQWTAPTPTSPYRYGGAAGPVDVNPLQGEEIARVVAALAMDLDLVGLNSADFLVSDEAVWLIEINPRPGATLDVFESEKARLFARHIAACDGRLELASSKLGFKAAEIVYAAHDVVVRGRGDWPDWALDRSAAGTRIAAGDPFCTVLGSGATVELARACASERGLKIIALVQETDH